MIRRLMKLAAAGMLLLSANANALLINISLDPNQEGSVPAVGMFLPAGVATINFNPVTGGVGVDGSGQEKTGEQSRAQPGAVDFLVQPTVPGSMFPENNDPIPSIDGGLYGGVFVGHGMLIPITDPVTSPSKANVPVGGPVLVAVPEPETLVLLLLGVVGMVVQRRCGNSG